LQLYGYAIEVNQLLLEVNAWEIKCDASGLLHITAEVEIIVFKTNGKP